jgi:mRNA-degrading endonuclease RelE of RelBE toxin-antitoxin system
MTRPQGFDVRVAPEVEHVLQRADRSGTPLRARFLVETERLAAHGLRSRSTRKLGGLDLWEARIGDYRAFFRLVPGTRTIAIGALVAKRTKRLRMDKLRAIERQVRTWENDLADRG